MESGSIQEAGSAPSEGPAERGGKRSAAADPPGGLRRPLAFVLPGGASMGAVQVGMLTALAAEGIRPDLVLGTSIGSINAAAYTGDPTSAGVASLATAWRNTRRKHVFAVRPLPFLWALVRRPGHLIDQSQLRRWLMNHIPIERLEHSPIPLHVMATDVELRVPVMLSSGPTVDALLASSAIAGVFPPVIIDGRRLSDGGAVANEPVPQAIALGAATVLVLSTHGHHPDGHRTLRGRVMAFLDRWLGTRPAPPDNGERFLLNEGNQLVAEDEAEPDGPGVEARPAAVVHHLPAPPTADLNPYSFRRTGHLIDAAAALTEAWIDEHLRVGVESG